MKFLTLLLIIILVVFFLSFNNGMSKQEIILYGVIKDHGKMIQQQNRVQFFGTGGAIPNKIHKFMISYLSREKLDVEEARKLLLSLAEDLIRRANANPEWEPYFNHYPVDENELELGIIFCDTNYKNFPPPFLAYALLMNGKLSYSLEDEESKKTVDVARETYEEALEKLGRKNTRGASD